MVLHDELEDEHDRRGQHVPVVVEDLPAVLALLLAQAEAVLGLLDDAPPPGMHRPKVHVLMGKDGVGRAQGL